MSGRAGVAGVIVALSLTISTAACDDSSSERKSVSTSRGGGLPSGDDTTIDRHVDGDTIGVHGGVRVRLIGVDTPETQDPRQAVQCFGKEASAFIARLLPLGTAIRLAFDAERYDDFGRTLAYVYRLDNGVFVNAELVREGFAQPLTIPPNVLHADEFVSLAAEAREAGRGLWEACAGIAAPPSTASAPAGCDPSYPGTCIPSPPPDLDCGDIGEHGFVVEGPDPHAFDGNGDGVGCE